jgi:inosine-uridine nucleoside N-ribohydrolase
MKKVIFDTDGGGDDLWAIAVLAGMLKQGEIDLKAITTCFGNTNAAQATRNVCDMLGVLNLPDILVYQGSNRPLSGLPPLLDGAYGSNGLSNASLPRADIEPQNEDAVTALTKILSDNEGQITILCTGPLTNIGQVFRDNPEFDRDTVEIVWLGGALHPCGGNHLPAKMENGEPRQGNITQYAEFNAINDPIAAQIIADLKHSSVTIMPLDATHHMVVGVTQVTEFLRMMKAIGQSEIAVEIASMLDNAAQLDQDKFDALGAFIHDPQTALYLTRPELFLPARSLTNVTFTNNHEAAQAFDAVACDFDFSRLERHGQMTMAAYGDGNICLIPGLTSFRKPDEVRADAIAGMQCMAEDRLQAIYQYILNAFEVE